MIFEEQVRKSAVDVRTHLLTGLCRSEDPDDRDLRRIPLLCGAMTAKQWWVEWSGTCLIMIYTVKSYAEEVH